MSHDVKKFFGLLLRKNGYVLEKAFFAAHRSHHAEARGTQDDLLAAVVSSLILKIRAD